MKGKKKKVISVKWTPWWKYNHFPLIRVPISRQCHLQSATQQTDMSEDLSGKSCCAGGASLQLGGENAIWECVCVCVRNQLHSKSVVNKKRLNNNQSHGY